MSQVATWTLTPSNKPGRKRPKPDTVEVVAVVGMIFAGVYRLNQTAVRSALEPRRRSMLWCGPNILCQTE